DGTAEPACRTRPSVQNQNQNHSVPSYSPTTDKQSLPPSFSNSSNLYQGEGKLSRNNCHNSRLPLLYK
ncbi:hypothetical protein M9458_030765, partial [Cirrhinus mrigala]